MPRPNPLILVILISGSLSAFGAEVESFQRWAILASPDIANSGVSDLLMTELSQRKFDLVEREQLAAITKEIELSKLLSPEGSSQRLKVGQLTKADALVLLSLVEHDKKKFVKLVISDCRYGSRLRLEHFPSETDRADKLAVEIAQAAAETRTKFARGVERIVAVSPFLSKNLTHEFDYLQFGFAALLGQSLSQNPGIAVLEIEEARAIGEELSLGTTELDRRHVPLFVEGEFEVLPTKDRTQSAKSKVQVRFQLRALDGREVRETLAHTTDNLSEATAWLIESLPLKLLRISVDDPSKAKSLTRPQQRELLTLRAATFARIAAYEQSTSLREAALLLDQDDWEQRVQLVMDHLRWHRRRLQDPTRVKLHDPRADPQLKEAWKRELRSQLELIMRNVEQVLAQQVLNPGEGDLLLSFTTMLQILETHSVLRDELREEFVEFYWRGLQHITQLDSSLRQGGSHKLYAALHGGTWNETKSALAQRDLWIGRALDLLADYLPRQIALPGTSDVRALAWVERLFMEVLPKSQLVPSLLPRLSSHNSMLLRPVWSRRVKVEDLVAFYGRLRATQQPLLEFYARFGLLGLKASGVSQQSVTAKDLVEVDWLQQFLATWEREHPDDAEAVRAAQTPLQNLRTALEAAFSRGGRNKTFPLTANPLTGRDPFPRLAFEPLEGVTAEWTEYTKVRNDLDLMWSWKQVAVMSKRGDIRVLFAPEVGSHEVRHDGISATAWDGENVWVASPRTGLQIFNPDGARVGHLTFRGETEAAAQDEASVLPPISHWTTDRGAMAFVRKKGLHLYPLGPGHGFVTGAFGADARRWFGVVRHHRDRLAGGEWRFDLWHRAIKRRTGAIQEPDDDIEESFDPTFIIDFTSPAEPQRRYVLLGRPGFIVGGGARRPLAFEIDTGQVSIFPFPIAPNMSDSSHCVIPRVGENFVFPSLREISRCRLPSEGLTGTTQAQPLVKLDFSPENILATPPPLQFLRPQLVAHEHWLYNPGFLWRRIDTRSWQTETLSEQPVSPRFQMESFGTSAHYGLVAWNFGDRLHRVHVDAPADQPRGTHWLYPFVPEARRERHAQAVERIRQLGGHVDGVWQTLELTNPISYRTEWQTMVFLSETWTGGDEGLKHLADLHELRRLYLVRAPVTNEGLKRLRPLHSLHILHIEETQVTDAGLDMLRDLSSLLELRLEGTVAGREFGDAALIHLAEHPMLKRLILYGAGFTDAGLPHLAKIPKLAGLYFLDTAVTKGATQQLIDFPQLLNNFYFQPPP